MKQFIVLILIISLLQVSCYGLTIVSIPDFLNKNTLTPKENRLAHSILQSIKNVNPDIVLMAGDLINGYQYLFPRLAKFNLSKLYKAWKNRINQYNFEVYPAVGDHELGDMPLVNWLGQTYMVPAYKQAYKKAFTLPTNGPKGMKELVYYVELEDTLIVTLYTFSRGHYFLRPKMNYHQLKWLEQVLAKTNKENIIVQGHLPILPVSGGEKTSKIYYQGRSDSPLWKIMIQYNVDFYLCGEFHAKSKVKKNGITQIVSNGNITTSHINYFVLNIGKEINYKFINIGDKSEY